MRITFVILVSATFLLQIYGMKITRKKVMGSGSAKCDESSEICKRKKSSKLNQAPQEFCSEKPDGLYADPEDCSGYYECAGGQTTRQVCEGGMLFNEAIGKCDDPGNVECSQPPEVPAKESKNLKTDKKVKPKMKDERRHKKSKKARLSNVRRSADENVDENLHERSRIRPRKHHRHHHRHHRSHIRRLKVSKDKIYQGERRTSNKGLNVRLKVQFKGPNLSGTLVSNDPLNPKEGDVTLAAVQNAEQGDPSIAQKNSPSPFNFGDGIQSQLSDSAKPVRGDVVIQASRMQDGTVQTSTSVRPKEVDTNQNAGTPANFNDILRDSFQTESKHVRVNNVGSVPQVIGTGRPLNRTESTKQDKERKEKSKTLQGILETINLIKSMSKGNESRSGKDDEEKSKSQSKETDKSQKTDKSEKEEKSGQESDTLKNPKSETVDSQELNQRPNGGILLLINKNSKNSSQEKDQEQGNGNGNAIVIMPNIGTKLKEKNGKNDVKEESESKKQEENEKNDKSKGKEVESGNGDVNSKEDKGQNKGATESGKESKNEKDKQNIGKEESKSDKTKNTKEETKSLEEQTSKETPKTSDSSLNPSVKSEHEKPKDDEINRDKQDATAISGLIGLIGNIVQNKLQSKLNATHVASNAKTKQEIDKNITIGKINISLQTADPSKLQKNTDKTSADISARYHPTVTMNQDKNVQENKAKETETKQNSNPIYPEHSNQATDLKTAFNDTPTKQESEPVMRIRLKGPASDNAAEQNKETQNSIVVNSVRNSDGTSKDDTSGFNQKPLHTTTVIIRNYNKEGKALSYGSEDQFDTLPMKGSDTFDAYGNRKMPSPVISMNDADDLLAGDKALIDNSAMSNSLFNPDAATFSERKEDMKIGKQHFGNAMGGKSEEDVFAQAILHQEDTSRPQGKMTYKEHVQRGQTSMNLPNEKAQAFKLHRFKEVEKPNFAKPHGPVVNGYNNYGPQQMGMQNQEMNDPQTGINIGKGVQMGMGGGMGGGPGLSPLEMQPIKGNSQEVENSMNQAITNMQDLAMKQIQQKYPGMQITMKQSDEEEDQEEQSQESGDNQEAESSGTSQELPGKEEETKAKTTNTAAEKGKESTKSEKLNPTKEETKEGAKEGKKDDKSSNVQSAKQGDQPLKAEVKLLDPKEMCKEKPSGVYAANDDPSKFIICYNGVSEERQCSHGMVFNPREKVCENSSKEQDKPKPETGSKIIHDENKHVEKKPEKPSPFKTITK